MTIAYAALHQLRWRAREHMKLSCGIRGNGWCVTHSLLNEVPYKAFSLTEDLEYSIDLALANYRVVYADEVQILGLLVSSETAATSQRQRWEGGRWSLIRSRLLPLLRASLRPNGKVCLDLALEILVPPLSYVFINIVLFMVAAGIATIVVPSMWPWLLISALCALSLIMYVMRGWQLSGVGMRGLLDLARVPSFVLWKLLVMLRKRGPEWVRTTRENS
jgi:cellulose synthase/poly-beta-1,6-N-acetylglucosamine synthase-like glycosyltransferase